ncbi:MAG: amino acid permease [Bacteroidota bacterium]
MSTTKAKFGTAPVFFTAISTILGAIMFLRFGFAVGMVGLVGTMAIILIGHAVTIPTAMAIAEIATNQKVEGGGEYYIISRSFGLVIGSTIGIALYLSQAISVAFYIMAFTEAFTPLTDWLLASYQWPGWAETLLSMPQTIGIPALLLLTAVILTKGADLGVKVLYLVVATLGLALVAFFLGQTEYDRANDGIDWMNTVHGEPVVVVENAGLSEFTFSGESREVELITEGGDIPPLIPPTGGGQVGSSSTGEGQVGSSSTRGGQMVSTPQGEGPAVSPPRGDGRGELDGELPSIGPQPDLPEAPTAPPLPPELGFFTVFAIIFPAFTGMTAGVGLSGDLRDPGKSIPLGTLAATIGGMVVYLLMAFKLSASAPPAELADTSRLVMADIAWQGWWIIPLGLAAATISSALGSILVAPRTLQAIAVDKIFPTPRINSWLSRGRGERQEPYNASLVTIGIAAIFIMAGALDSVAEIISMFFMVTYGSLCLISFLNHFASDPSYRPRFRSKWYVSLFGAVACFGLMFFMNSGYAAVALLLIGLLYFYISWSNPDKQSLALIFQGVIFQFSRRLQIFLQKADKEEKSSWRPSAIAASNQTFNRLGVFNLLRWISHRYGFGTYIHYIQGYLSHQSHEDRAEIKERIIRMAESTNSRIYVDTTVSPSYTSSIAQIVQFPGIAGAENNLLFLEFSKQDQEGLDDIIDNFSLINAVDFNLGILGVSERGFGHLKQIHIWLERGDYKNGNLMILLGYILLGHPDWAKAEIKLYAVFEESRLNEGREQLYQVVDTGQLPISRQNIEVICRQDDADTRSVINARSGDADLVIVGFQDKAIKKLGKEMFAGYEGVGNVLFVNAAEGVEIR